MTIWRDKIDPKITTLMMRMAKSQIDFGVKEIVVDHTKIRKKRRELLLTGQAKKPVALFGSLESHEKAINCCQKCPLGETRTKFVYGVGNPHAGIMFVGEAPGRDEDLKGEPFVGRAGQLLDKILAAINFKRGDVYIANILKCRPPENRDPQPAEMELCLPHLMEQINIIRPKIICALGRISAQALLKTSTPLSKLRLRWHEFNHIPFIVTYHPAALLRFPDYKKDCWEDVKMLRAKYDQLIAEKM